MDGRAVTRNLPLNPAKVQNQTLENDSKTKLTTTKVICFCHLPKCFR